MLNKVFGLRQVGDARFKSDAAGEGGMRVYGGFTLAQSLLAALSSVDDAWTCYVMHVQFIRPAGPDGTLEYHLEATSNGRSFATRRVTCFQAGKVIITATMSFRRESEGLNFQQPPPRFPVSPDGLPSERERSMPLMEYLRAQGLNPQELPSGIDVRLTEAQDYFDPKPLPAVHPF